MAYHETTRILLKTTPRSLGVVLGRLALKKAISVSEVAKRTGASRTTVYSWFAGRGITNAYKRTVEELIQELRIK